MRTSQCLQFRPPVEKLRSAPSLSRNSLLHRPPTGGAISASSQSGLHATERVPAKERDGLEKQLQANPTARVRRRLRSLPLLGSATRHAPRGDFRVYSSSGEISTENRFRKNFSAAVELLAARPLCSQDKYDVLMCFHDQLPTSVVQDILNYAI